LTLQYSMNAPTILLKTLSNSNHHRDMVETGERKSKLRFIGAFRLDPITGSFVGSLEERAYSSFSFR
jgi:hypothetical protein